MATKTNENLNQNPVIEEKDLDKVNGGVTPPGTPFEGIPESKPFSGFF